MTYEQIMAALRKADAAGDTEGAQRLAIMAQNAQQQPVDQPQGIGAKIYENVIGRGEIDTPGERLGATIKDVGSSLASGVGRGTVALGTALGYAGSGSVGNFGEVMGQTQDIAADVVPPIGYEPQTTAGEYAQTIGEFIPATAATGGIAAIPMYAGVAGAASELGGQLTEGTKAEPYARLAGAILGPMGLAGGARAISRAITPHPTDPARIAFANQLDDAGVQLTAGQRTGSESLKYREAATVKGQEIAANQLEDFTAAALQHTGSTARRATTEVMSGLRESLGSQFKVLAARNNITADQTLVDDVAAAVDDYMNLTSKTNVAPMLGNLLARIKNKLTTGQPLTGREYQRLRSDLGKATVGADRNLQGSATAAINAIDDALGRTLQLAGNTDDIANYVALRDQYRSFLAIEKAVAGPSEGAAYGLVTPGTLRTAIVQQGKRSYVTGDRELGELARAGQATMKPLPQSGTAPRAKAMSLTPGATDSGTGLTLGGLTYAATKDPVLTAMATAAGSQVPRAIQSARASMRMTPFGQSYLSNQVVTGSGPELFSAKSISALSAFLESIE